MAMLRANQRERTNVLNCLKHIEEKKESLYMRMGSMPGRCYIRGPPGTISYPEPSIRSRASGAEYPQPDVVLRSGWMAGVLSSMPEKATAIPPNDVESLRAKPRAVTSVK
jgi:hypothetical protein